jgi:tetratricopeptide (TPR) repeat protein
MLRTVQASLFADLGRTDAAVAEIKKALEEKKDRETYLTLAQVYEKGKRYQEMARAIDDAEQLSQSKDEKETIYFLRGAMYEKLKQYDKAEQEFRRVLAANPDNSSAMNYLGYMLADRNERLPEALQLIQGALDREPGNGAYLDSLGWVYFRMGKFEEAEQNLKMALEKISKDPTIHDHLGDVYAKQGKLKEAVGQWEMSLKAYETASASDSEPSDVAKVQKKLEGARVRLAKENSAGVTAKP